VEGTPDAEVWRCYGLRQGFGEQCTCKRRPHNCSIPLPSTAAALLCFDACCLLHPRMKRKSSRTNKGICGNYLASNRDWYWSVSSS
jgi:hypothetical protein